MTVSKFPSHNVNVGSLFQNLPASAGIDPNDSSYQFILSQADGTLRFTTTDLTPTNYLNYLQDTNEASVLANAPLTTITANGVTLPQSFISGIATNNQSIILVEAASATTNPLVLTIYHGTNQLAKTSLALSITGVEQMFRHKNLLLSASAAMPDRLADEDVPNEPDTNDKNFVFLHGWPLGRHKPQYPIGTLAAGEWHHSDIRAIAYTFTYKVFNKMVTVGNLQ